jgi:hypothetical protein
VEASSQEMGQTVYLCDDDKGWFVSIAVRHVSGVAIAGVSSSQVPYVRCPCRGVLRVRDAVHSRRDATEGNVASYERHVVHGVQRSAHH